MILENRVVKFSVRRAWKHGCKARQVSRPRKGWRDAPVVVRKSVDEMTMDLVPLEKRIVFRAVDGYLTTGIATRSCTVPNRDGSPARLHRLRPGAPGLPLVYSDHKSHPKN